MPAAWSWDNTRTATSSCNNDPLATRRGQESNQKHVPDGRSLWDGDRSAQPDSLAPLQKRWGVCGWVTRHVCYSCFYAQENKLHISHKAMSCLETYNHLRKSSVYSFFFLLPALPEINDDINKHGSINHSGHCMQLDDDIRRRWFGEKENLAEKR